jgi:hypothetical protein
MDQAGTPRRSAVWRYGSVLWLGFLAGLIASCSTAETDTAQPAAEPGDKTTCEEIVPTLLVGDLELTDRVLIPYSRTLLGVEAEYEGSDGVLTVVSGGFLDDQIEAYDNLLPIDDIPVIGGHTAELHSGTFFDEPVLMATWKDPGLDPLCQLRAVVTVGLELAEFRTIIAGLGTRTPGRADN